MRCLGNHGNIAYVTASVAPLNKLYGRGNFTSPFPNIFSEVRLSQFTSEETSEFLSAKREGVVFTEKEIEFIKRIARNHPLHLQIACYHVLENQGKKWDEKKLRKKIEGEIENFKSTRFARRKRWIYKHKGENYNEVKEWLKLINPFVKK